MWRLLYFLLVSISVSHAQDLLNQNNFWLGYQTDILNFSVKNHFQSQFNDLRLSAFWKRNWFKIHYQCHLELAPQLQTYDNQFGGFLDFNHLQGYIGGGYEFQNREISSNSEVYPVLGIAWSKDKFKIHSGFIAKQSQNWAFHTMSYELYDYLWIQAFTDWQIIQDYQQGIYQVGVSIRLENTHTVDCRIALNRRTTQFFYSGEFKDIQFALGFTLHDELGLAPEVLIRK